MHRVQKWRVAQALRPIPSDIGAALRHLVVTWAVAAVVIAADQGTKSWAIDRLSRGSIHVIWKLDFILAYNSGVSFSLAQGWSPVIVVFAVLAIAVISLVASKTSSSIIAVGLGFVMGGAAGNLSDRLFRSNHGAVVDFIALHFWPTFNVADSCICIGAVVLALAWCFPRRPQIDGDPGA